MKILSFSRRTALLLGGVIALAACAPTDSQIQKAVEKNPEIVFKAIEKNPERFIEVLNKATQEQRRLAEEKRLAREFANPKKPVIEPDRVVWGNPDAPITIVEYSDFECPYCARAHPTVDQLIKEYGDKVRVVYKHLPLAFHKLAMPAARYFEAVAVQKPELSKQYHDILFKNQKALKTGGENYLKRAAQQIGVDMDKLAQDLNSPAVTRRIQADTAEAQKFGIRGTPGFLINGVSLRGAQPLPEFKKIIDRHLAAK